MEGATMTHYFKKSLSLVLLAGALLGGEQLVQAQTAAAKTQSTATIVSKLNSYTKAKSAGPTKDYYYTNGKARFGSFAGIKTGGTHFASDSHHRSATARAVLTYGEYKSSKGSRQGTPRDPYKWPSSNPIVAVTYSLTHHTYHGYLWNRSHSIGDSLLGKKSYTSSANFTTGTRSQNVGADQNGGMRYAEEKVEHYWASHPGTKRTVKYETTPVYHGNEVIPRGSIVDIKSSDNKLNTEVVVLNSDEGVKINYSTGKATAKKTVTKSKSTTKKTTKKSTKKTVKKTVKRTSKKSSKTHKSGKWTVAASGKVFVSNSNIYYTKVKNPGNYTYESRSAAIHGGARKAVRGNGYAQP
ncbi:prophage Lp1 protein 2 [Secundilactobacillus odoratitofui DSM 19909 = JCM 15043]|uniref:Prophage Lp1 protein 2 n=2 Tax=Secundilactobacillus odoratitofui TaxID=480930 RepID=A0A0R1LSF0_9LACO|nr:prophage Lp1 protein 2 [Secundilactobacillus odoratitofui DSM 19909 = JCM 15043]